MHAAMERLNGAGEAADDGGEAAAGDGEPVVCHEAGCTFNKWKLRLGAPVTPGAEVACATAADGRPVSLKSPAVGTLGWLDGRLRKGHELRAGRPVALVSRCAHSVVMKDMCADCGMDLRAAGGLPGERTVRAAAAIPMIHSVPELHVAPSVARVHAAADAGRLVAGRKLALLIDLDQTVLHTTNEIVPNDLKDVHHYQLYGAGSVWYHTRVRPAAVETLRRLADIYELHIATFGQRAYAHTMARLLDPDGRGIFAERILSRDECFDPTTKTANLAALFPCGDHMAVIIDDRPDVWQYAANAIAVKPYRYFAQTGDINAPPAKQQQQCGSHGDGGGQMDKGSASCSAAAAPPPLSRRAASAASLCAKHRDTGGCVEGPAVVPSEADQPAKETEAEPEKYAVHEDDGDYMAHLEDILRRIHRAYYEVFDMTRDCKDGDLDAKEYDGVPLKALLRSVPSDTADDQPCTSAGAGPAALPDTKSLVPLVRGRTLSGCRLVLSGVVPAHVRQAATPVYRSAVEHGATVQPAVVPPPHEGHTTHVVAAKWGTSKVHLAARHPASVRIVTPQWLWASVERWRRAAESEHRLRPGADAFDLATLPLHLSGRPIGGSASAPDLTAGGGRRAAKVPGNEHGDGERAAGAEGDDDGDSDPTAADSEEHVHFSLGELESMQAEFDKEMSDSEWSRSASDDEAEERGDSDDHIDNGDDESEKKSRKRRRPSADSSSGGRRSPSRRRSADDIGGDGDDEDDDASGDSSIGSVDDEMADAVEDFLKDDPRAS